jgi:hypothetical protein
MLTKEVRVRGSFVSQAQTDPSSFSNVSCSPKEPSFSFLGQLTRQLQCRFLPKDSRASSLKQSPHTEDAGRKQHNRGYVCTALGNGGASKSQGERVMPTGPLPFPSCSVSNHTLTSLSRTQSFPATANHGRPLLQRPPMALLCRRRNPLSHNKTPTSLTPVRPHPAQPQPRARAAG